jgi:hypothetical protein
VLRAVLVTAALALIVPVSAQAGRVLKVKR